MTVTAQRGLTQMPQVPGAGWRPWRAGVSQQGRRRPHCPLLRSPMHLPQQRPGWSLPAAPCMLPPWRLRCLQGSWRQPSPPQTCAAAARSARIEHMHGAQAGVCSEGLGCSSTVLRLDFNSVRLRAGAQPVCTVRKHPCSPLLPRTPFTNYCPSICHTTLQPHHGPLFSPPAPPPSAHLPPRLSSASWPSGRCQLQAGLESDLSAAKHALT